MGGLFGTISKSDCVQDLFYGTDYHSHLGTKRGVMAVMNSNGLKRSIHNIENDYFRSKFEPDLPKLHGTKGIGVISDYDSQPLIIGSQLGTFALVMGGTITQIRELA
ncbi:MAG: amidophosphoribosyltransferase, partial [Bacteroidota bacterium]